MRENMGLQLWRKLAIAQFMRVALVLVLFACACRGSSPVTPGEPTMLSASRTAPIDLYCAMRIGSTCSVTTLSKSLTAALQSAATRGVAVRLWSSSPANPAELLGESGTWSAPNRHGDRFAAKSRKDWVAAQAATLLKLLTPRIEAAKGHQQELVEALGTIALASPATLGREIWVVSDGRNVSGPRYGDQDCETPDPKKFAQATSSNALPPISLKGITVRFLFTSSNQPQRSDRRNCRMSARKVAATRSAWTMAIEKANGSVSFLSDVPALEGAE